MGLFDTALIKKFPQSPGVYVMKNKKGVVLYVGKAKNLRVRVRQYFRQGGDGRAMIPWLVSQVLEIDTFIVSSEKEALLLEHTLIKQYKPKYNALLKDDKSMIAIVMKKHKWPKLDVVRYRQQPKRGELVFGPYPHVQAARTTLNLVEKLFPIRECSDQEFIRRTRPCILYDIKRCLAPCVGLCTEKEYNQSLSRAVQFLRGESREVLASLRREMEVYSKKLQFEQAQKILKTIESIEKTLERQYVDLPKNAHIDFFGLYRVEQSICIAKLMVRKGRLNSYKYFHFTNVLEEDPQLMVSLLLQHYTDNMFPPKEIALGCAIEDKSFLEELLSIKVSVPQKGYKKRLVDLAYDNAKTTMERQEKKLYENEQILLELKEALHLQNFPQKIECFDQSHMGGSNPVSVAVSFRGGEPDKKKYRTYKVSQKAAQNDYLALQEVLERRYSKLAQEDMPDLIIIDGGKGHLNIALKVLKKINTINTEVIGLAKEEARHDKGMTKEKVYLPLIKEPLILSYRSKALFFLQRVRDEAHRFTINFQKKLRSKDLTKSILDDIPGIGPQKKKALLRHFGSINKIFKSTEDELLQVRGISKKNCKDIRDFVQEQQ